MIDFAIPPTPAPPVPPEALGYWPPALFLVALIVVLIAAFVCELVALFGDTHRPGGDAYRAPSSPSPQSNQPKNNDPGSARNAAGVEEKPC